MRTLRIASRASRLALAQAEIVKDLLHEILPDVEVSILEVTTKGDRDRSNFLYKSESVGLFTSEVENALLAGRAELAVHSLKDLPTSSRSELTIAVILKRQWPADALVAKERAESIQQLPPGASVGTSSLRRIAQLKHLRADITCVPLRGNVETRVRKVLDAQVDAAIVACAGLYRLGLTDSISAVLPPNEFVIAPGQGALAVQIRTADTQLARTLSRLDDEPTRIATEAERTVLAAMHGGCSIPLGVYAETEKDTIRINAMIADLEGTTLIKRSASGPASQSKRCALRLAEELLRSGGREILEQIRSNRTNIRPRDDKT